MYCVDLKEGAVAEGACALAHIFKDWDIQKRDTEQLHWGGTTLRSSRVYLAAVVSVTGGSSSADD